MSVDTGTAYKDIVDNRKTAFATNPVALAILQAAVG